MTDAFHHAIEPPSSPPLPVQPRQKRKRLAPSFLLDESTPSDPAIFSSDPADPGVENYLEPRKKKVYKGTWWQTGQEAEGSVTGGRKAFERNLDSGVWMGSESSAMDSESFGSDDTVPDDEVFRNVLHEQRTTITKRTYQPEPPNVALARKVIMVFAENGESLDPTQEPDPSLREWLSEHHSRVSHLILNLNLLSIPYITDDMLAPLCSLVRPRVDDHNDPQSYEALKRCYCITLERNALAKVPRSLLSLPGLTELSLAYNNLTAVPTPPSGGGDLRSLDVCGNRLRWLTGELLQNIHSANHSLSDLQVASNPLVQPFSYVGFSTLIGDGAVKEGSWDIPLLLDELLNKMRAYASVEREEETANTTLQTFVQQKKWIVRLCEHYLHFPEILLYWNHLHENDLFDVDLMNVVSDRWHAQFMSDLSTDATHLKSYVTQCLGRTLPRLSFLMAGTPVTYLDICGRPIGSGKVPPSEVPPDQTILPAQLIKLPTEPPQPLFTTPSMTGGFQTAAQPRVHSLFSLALKAAAKFPELPQLPSLLPDDAPRSVSRALYAAMSAKDEGVTLCNTCGRSYIIPRAEWLEYRHLPYLTYEVGDGHNIDAIFIPFLMRACSWGCVPEYDYESD